MIKNYLFKVTLLIVLLLHAFTKVSAQYAIGGTAGPTLYNSVYWLTWDKAAQGSTLITAPAGADAQHILDGTYVWQFSPTVRITAVISNQSTINGPMMAYTPGDYYADGLDVIYSGNNQPKPASRGVNSSGLVTSYGGTVNFDIDIKVEIFINNQWVSKPYPGMIIADAESIDTGGEYITGTTPNPIAWQLLNKRTQGISGDDHYKMELSNSGKTFRLFADQPPGNFGVQAVMFARGAHTLTNVGMKGSGLTAMAVGFVLPFDLGDDPNSYGITGNYIDDFQMTDYFVADNIYPVVSYPTTPLIPQAHVFIGADNVDPDGQPVLTGINANNDNLVGNDDENTLTPSNLPDIKVNQAGNVVIQLPVTNNKSEPATLYSWIDFNGDHIFSVDEMLQYTVPANTVNQVITLTYPNATFAGKIKVGPLYTRFRITTTPLLDNPLTATDERSTSFAADGETEDYRFKDVLGINVSGTVVNDGNGAADGAIAGTGVQSVSGAALYAYLVDSNGLVVAQTPVAANGTYTFGNVNNGNYTVAISTKNVASGSPLSAVAANLPAGWQPSGASYGINNAGHTGIQPGTPNLQVAVSTPGTSLDISGITLGLTQGPVAKSDTVTTNAGQQVVINAPANDSDASGALNPASIQLIDPADNVKKTSVTIPSQGTYTLNTTTGQVTFTPVPAFAGKVTPVNYTIKNNLGVESLPAPLVVYVKPVGVNDAARTLVNTPVTINVKGNDGPAAAATTVSVNPPAHGSVTTDASGQITYTPANNFTGQDTYTYVLTTADGLVSDPITVTVDVYTTSLTLTKVATNGVSKAGDIINYNLVVRNTSSVPLTNLVVTDAGADVGSITPASIATLLPGATAQVTAKHTVTQAEVTIGSFSNQASVTGRDPNGNIVSKLKSDNPNTTAVDDPTTVLIAPAGSISLTKTGVFSAYYITYTFTIKNTGNSVLTNVLFTDTKLGISNAPVNEVPTGGLLPNGTVTFPVTYTLTQADKDAGTVTNTASVTSRDAGGNLVSSTANATTTFPKSPTASNDAAFTTVNKPVVITVLANDNPGSSSFNQSSIEILTPPAHGTVTANADGTVLYTPNPGYAGTDVFTYRVKDLYGFYTNPATVTIASNSVSLLKVPTLFTPNGDGANDAFEIRGLEQFPENELVIVNRWGNEVYHQSNYKNNWTGEGLNEGTYYYILKVRDTDWQVIKGYITLMRTLKN